ncbi:ROK family protein [Ruania halotolerans]|uniref:ROK family protein n=1 Tax=Ruania halotolerans TaxID=2897773 RepID=UPI001E4ED7C6|nr:ROK family protein [Ruania halotolerans]UFU08062.1 ROK family protein [Ruania halotolerans]
MRELLVRGPLPRAELARRLELSPASLTKSTRSLLTRGVITENAAPMRDSRGRPGIPVSVAIDDHQFLGVKITGDHVFAVRTNAAGRVLDSARRPLATTEVDAVATLIVHLVNDLAGVHPVQSVGIGVAGTMDRFDDRVRNNLYLGWHDVPLAELVRSRTGLPTVISGDVRALTAGVHWSGPGRELDDFAVVTIGVGIGMGLVLGGQTVAGVSGGVGRIAHTRVTDSGPPCSLGHRGCAAVYLESAPIVRAVAYAHDRVDLDLAAVCDLAAAGDPAASRVLSDAGHALGVVLAGLVNTLGLPALVLAGDGLIVLDHGRPAMNRALAEYLDPDASAPAVHLFASDFDEWARGAAVVACQWLLVDPPADRADL